MTPSSILALVKLGGGVLVAVAVAAFLIWLKHTVDQNHTLTAEHQAHLACVDAVGAKAGAKTPIAAGCEQAIIDAATARDRSASCDAALTAKPENLFGAQAACTAPVKTLMAQRDAAAAERDNATEQLAQATADENDALQRAVSRAQTEAQRNADARSYVASQPHGGDGLVDCAADCLQHLAEAQPAATGP